MDFTELKNYMDRLVTEYNVPGADCIVYKDHKQIFRYFNGKSDIENNKPMCGDELYLIFSMTKMITSVCILQLIERGKCLLNDPISMYLPEFEKMKVSDGIITHQTVYAQKNITIKDLLTMCAGFDYDLNADYIKKSLIAGKTSTIDLVRAMSNAALGFEPGTRFRYSLCYDVLGGLIEVISHKKLGEYMKENIFDPLDMNYTFFGVPNDVELLSKMSARYTYGEDGIPKRLPLECVFNFSPEYESGGAGLVSCTENYAVFLDALACGGTAKNGNKILSASSVNLMGMNHLKEKQYEDFQHLLKGYGYGFGVRTHVDKTESGSLSPIGEFGWDGAAGAFSLVDIGNGVSMTYFQEIHGWKRRIQSEMRNVLYSCLEH